MLWSWASVQAARETQAQEEAPEVVVAAAAEPTASLAAPLARAARAARAKPPVSPAAQTLLEVHPAGQALTQAGEALEVPQPRKYTTEID